MHGVLSNTGNGGRSAALADAWLARKATWVATRAKVLVRRLQSTPNIILSRSLTHCDRENMISGNEQDAAPSSCMVYLNDTSSGGQCTHLHATVTDDSQLTQFHANIPSASMEISPHACSSVGPSSWWIPYECFRGSSFRINVLEQQQLMANHVETR